MTPEELKDWRKSLGMSQVTFSQWIKPKRTPQQINRWENGHTPIPEWLDAVKVAKENENG